MNRLALVSLAILLAHPREVAGQGAPPAKVTASLGRVFGHDLKLDTVRVDSVPVLRVRRADSLLGFARIRNVIGKDQPITFLVAVDPAGRLRDIDVLVYREPYGGEVAYESWRKQFRGKSAADPLVAGRDIRGISGATISVNAVTQGVRRSVAEFAEWLKQGLLR